MSLCVSVHYFFLLSTSPLYGYTIVYPFTGRRAHRLFLLFVIIKKRLLETFVNCVWWVWESWGEREKEGGREGGRFYFSWVNNYKWDFWLLR